MTSAAIAVEPTATGVGHRLRSQLFHDPTTLIGGLGVLFFLTVAIFAPLLAPYPPLAVNVLHITQGPTWPHPFGTDELGRDVFSRVIVGTRASMLVGLVSTGIGAAIGTAIGAFSGYVGGWLDEVIMRCLDIVLAFPQVVLAIALAATLGPSLTNVIGIIAFLFIPQFARVVRGSVLVIKEMDYVVASRVVGVSRFRTLVDHVVPNAFGPVLVLTFLSIPSAILTEAALSFLGVGIQPPAPSWGNLIADGSNNLLIDPWIAVFPGITITVAVLAFNFLGDGLRDAFDPANRNTQGNPIESIQKEIVMELAIRPGTVIDCTGAAARQGIEVVVSGERIKDVRPVGTGEPLAPETVVISVPGATLMPGMMDLHMHVFQWGQRHDIPWQKESILEAGLRGLRNASTLLDLGVTTARDVASRDNLSIQLRDLINVGMVRGPRFYASGTQLEAVGRAAYFFPAIYVNGPDEARSAARLQLRAGADWIKIMATSGVGGGTGHLVGEPGWQELTEEEIRAVTVEARHAGRKVTTHAIGNGGIKAALRAGVDCVEHGDFLDEEAIELMLERDVPLVPTLIITKNLGEHGAERGFEANIVERAKRTLEAGMDSALMAHKAGVRVAVGSDVDLDETAAQEVRMLIEAGFSSMDALMAATRVPASVLDRGADLGTIEIGKIADLILLDGNPLEDPFALDRVSHVVHNGQLVKAPAGTSGHNGGPVMP